MMRATALVPAVIALVVAAPGTAFAQEEEPPRDDAATQPASSRAEPRVAEATESDPARQLLRRAIDSYMVGRYGQAVALLRPLVEARVLEDRADQQEALRIYGIALYLVGARVGAERAFRHLLRIAPSARLDLSFVRPEVVAFFEQVRRRFAHELDRVARRSAPRGSAVANLLVPWGQFQNGHRGKGYALLAGELSLVATSIVTAALLYGWRSPTGEFGDRDHVARSLQVVNTSSVLALVGLFSYGIIDGLYFYYRGPRPTLEGQ